MLTILSHSKQLFLSYYHSPKLQLFKQLSTLYAVRYTKKNINIYSIHKYSKQQH